MSFQALDFAFEFLRRRDHGSVNAFRWCVVLANKLDIIVGIIIRATRPRLSTHRMANTNAHVAGNTEKNRWRAVTAGKFLDDPKILRF
jgi:hypothetical protein